MAIGDNLFKRVEDKTNISKNTILDLAKKIQDKNLKDENVLRELIKDVSLVAGKKVTKEQEEKIINTVLEDNVPKDIDNYI